MVEIGVVKKHSKDKGVILVEFKHLATERECKVLQPTTGDNNVFVLPSIGTQVACWIDGGNSLVLGAIYSSADKPPPEAAADGMYQQYGKMVVAIERDKLSIKNNATSVKKLCKGIVGLIEQIKVSTPQGPGTLDPSMLTQIEEVEMMINNIFK